MTQNTSHAVMAQRAEPHDSLDDFPTPPWAVRAFCEMFAVIPGQTVWEPAANRGHMSRALAEYFDVVHASDVQDYGVGIPVHDFLLLGEPLHRPDWVITNPPFRLAQQFVARGLEVSRRGVAVLVRSVWSEGVGRFEQMFRDTPPTEIFQYAERVPMVKGRYDPSASTATAYAWFVWDKSSRDGMTEFIWIPPSRKRFERPGDAE